MGLKRFAKKVMVRIKRLAKPKGRTVKQTPPGKEQDYLAPASYLGAKGESPRVDKRRKAARLGPDAWLHSGEWVLVRSSNVAAIAYRFKPKQLLVQFLDGSVYEYDLVPPRTAKDMFGATSMGRFVWRRLRDKYPYRKVS